MNRGRGPTGDVTAALITGERQIEYLTFASGVLHPGMIKVDIHLCGICGTDLAAYKYGQIHSPAVCGHEWVGTVAELGSGITTLELGDRVVIAVRPPCGECPECRNGLSEHCSVALAMARGRDSLAPLHGGFAKSITVEANRVIGVPPELSDEDAAMIEPATIAFHGVRRSHIAQGDTVVVQGGGPVGLLALQFARAAGAGYVCLIEPLEQRRSLGLSLGADTAVATWAEADELVKFETHGLGADLVLECAGVPSLIQTAVDLVRRGGSVTILSYISQPALIEPSRWLSKEVTVRGSVAFNHADFSKAIRFMVDSRVKVAPLHTATVGFFQLEDALANLASTASTHIKILIDPRVDSFPHGLENHRFQ